MPGWLERHQLLVVGLAGLVLLAGVAVVYFDDEGSPAPIVFRTDSDQPAGSPIRVHVAGAVDEPGVYGLREGDRVLDALSAAGGPTDAADLDALNLARRVHDEEQVVVPRRTGSIAGGAAAPLPSGAKVDINNANEAQLDQLPGIGEAYSRRIVDSRKVDGPFRSTQELVDRRVLPRATYEKIRDLISVAAP